MSSKGTIFLTNDNEHCYEETNEMDGGEFRVYLEIDPKNIMSFSMDGEGIEIAIRGDSHLARCLRSAND